MWLWNDVIVSGASVDDAPSAVTWLSQCIADVEEWLSVSRLRLNPAKTVVMWLDAKHQVEKVTVPDIPVLQLPTTTEDTARDLGLMPYSQLTMSAQVGAVCRSAYNYLRQPRPVVWMLSVEARKTVVDTFCILAPRLLQLSIIRRYSLVQWLQAVQNAAARLVTGTRRCAHITPVLRQLHWLPVRHRIKFKVASYWCTRHWTDCHFSTLRTTRWRLSRRRTIHCGNLDK